MGLLLHVGTQIYMIPL